MSMHQGLVRRTDYASIEKSTLLRELEEFSVKFSTRTHSLLAPYAKRWVKDPLHQWSRMWEYPFVAEAIATVVDQERRDDLNILDAGSGLTFFPYYLHAQYPSATVSCVDSDSLLPSLFDQVNVELGERVRFNAAGIDCIPGVDGSVDVIYCISVLEHTRNYAHIVREFRRLLRPGGRLVLTFDVSLNVRADIPLSEAKVLIDELSEYFLPTDDRGFADIRAYNSSMCEEIVTTHHVRRNHPERLPWRFPRLSGMLAAVRRRVIPLPIMKELTVCCLILTAK